MKPRDRQLAAIRRQLADRVSIDSIQVENIDAIAKILGVSEQEAYDHLGIDGRIVAPQYIGRPLSAPDGKPGGEWGSAAVDEYGTSSVYPFSGESTLSEVESYPWPDPNDYDYHGAAAVMREYQELYAVRGPYWRPIFCSVCSLMGMEETLISMLEGADIFEAILERVVHIMKGYYKNMLDVSGPDLDIFCLGDDFATQRGLLMSPSLWRKYLLPIYRDIFAMAKSRGKPVWFHSCGDITEILPDLIDAGIDVWETVQLHTLPISPVELKKRFGGNLTFFGGVNTQRLPFADIPSVVSEVKECIRVLGKNGGYICGPDHHIKNDVSPELTLALFEAAKAFRGEGCTL